MIGILRASVILGAVLGTAGQARSDYIYWTDAGKDSQSAHRPGGDIRRANLDGSGQVTLIAGLDGPNSIAFDRNAQTMYWVDGDGLTGVGDIRRANFDGSSQQFLLAQPYFPVSLAVDAAAGTMYWLEHRQQTEPFGLDIKVANLDGSAQKTLIHTAVQVGNGQLALDLSGGKIYWSDANDGWIRVANLDGSGISTLVTGQRFPWGVALDPAHGKIYWADFSGGDIRRANLDGSAQETLIRGLPGPGGLALDLTGGQMYWADSSGGDIRRANLDGSGQQTLVSGLTNWPSGIALLPSVPEPSTLAMLAVLGLGMGRRRQRTSQLPVLPS